MRKASVAHWLPLALAPILGAGCHFLDSPVRLGLPPSAVRVASESSAFRVYRYPIHGTGPAAVAKLDAFNHGLDDLVVANPGSSSVSLFRNNGNGTFREVAQFASCPGGDGIDGEDLSGDGYADFVVNCHDHSVLSLFLGDGRGNFTRHDIPVAAGPLGAQSAPHVDHPGTPYLAVLHDAPAELELLYNHGAGGFVRQRTLPVPAAPSQLVSDIFTPDGAISYAVVSQAGSSLSVYLNQGGEFVRTDYPAPEAAGAVATFDLRARGYLDLVVASGTRNSFRVYLNDGAGRFSRSEEFVLPGGPAGAIGSSHLRGLAQDEILFQSSLTGDLVFFPNLGGGQLGSPETVRVGGVLAGMITGHFLHHADDMDAAMIDTQTGELVVLLNERADF